jgi:hypothetical protein
MVKALRVRGSLLFTARFIPLGWIRSIRRVRRGEFFFITVERTAMKNHSAAEAAVQKHMLGQ